MRDPYLTTGRLRLRQITQAHLEDLFRLDDDPVVMKFINGGLRVPRETFMADRKRWIGGLYQPSPDLGFWAAHAAEDDAFIGWFHLHNSPVFEDEIELGYRLKRDAWGRGYATEGSQALLHNAFSHLGLNRVTAHTLIGNAASRRVMEKVGMTVAQYFVLPEELCPFWNEEERRAVQYGISKKPE